MTGYRSTLNGLAAAFLIAALAMAGLAGASGAANAEDGGPWTVVVASKALLMLDGKPSLLKAGAIVDAGARITTLDGGAVVLSRGQDLVTMAANSQIFIVDPQPGNATLIEQPFGDASYEVTKESHPHFQVDAPLLATVVKGTKFTVHAQPDNNSVAVTEGRVQAVDRTNGKSTYVGRGQKAEARSKGGNGGQSDTGTSEAAAAGKASGGPATDSSATGGSAAAASGSARSAAATGASDAAAGSGKGSSGKSGSASSGSGKSGSGKGGSGGKGPGGKGPGANGPGGNGPGGNGPGGDGPGSGGKHDHDGGGSGGSGKGH